MKFGYFCGNIGLKFYSQCSEKGLQCKLVKRAETRYAAAATVRGSVLPNQESINMDQPP